MAVSNKLTCTQCGCEKSIKRDFYASNSRTNSQNQRIPVCKKCLKEDFLDLVDSYDGNEKLALKHLLMNFDIYYDEKIYNESKDEDDILASYLTKVNTKVKDKTSKDNKLVDDEEELSDEHRKLITKWGENRRPNEYERLETLEKLYMEQYPSNTLQEQVIIRALCDFEVEKEKCRANGDYANYDKIDRRISAKMEELNVIPSKTKAYMEDDNMVVGYLINMVETDRPVPEVADEFKDVDEIEKMIERYYLSPIRKVMNWTKTKVGKLFGKDGDEDDTK